MKILTCAFAASACHFALAITNWTEVVVYSHEKSAQQLHVATMPTNVLERSRRWDFPSSYTGHRAVCGLSGASSNEVFCAWIGGDSYVPGNPFGVSTGRDYPQIELTAMSSIAPRIDVATGICDREMILGEANAGLRWKNDGFSNPNDVEISQITGHEHVRIVPYLVYGTKGIWDKVARFVLLRAVAEFDVAPSTHEYVTEADFIRGDQFDIDWDGFMTRDFALDGDMRTAVGEVTAVKYRIIIGRDGPIGPVNNLDTTTVVRAYSKVIERRFETFDERTLPSSLKLEDGNVLYGARPTFRWRLDEPTTANDNASSAAVFGCSYTAFAIEVADASDTSFSNTVYSSGIRRAPVRKDGYFTWTAGNDTDLGTIFSRTGNWIWRVAMYNAKFLPELGGWSDYSAFSTTANVQQ